MKHIQCAVNDVPFDIILYRTIVTTIKMGKRKNIRSNYRFFQLFLFLSSRKQKLIKVKRNFVTLPLISEAKYSTFHGTISHFNHIMSHFT